MQAGLPTFTTMFRTLLVLACCFLQACHPARLGTQHRTNSWTVGANTYAAKWVSIVSYVECLPGTFVFATEREDYVAPTALLDRLTYLECHTPSIHIATGREGLDTGFRIRRYRIVSAHSTTMCIDGEASFVATVRDREGKPQEFYSTGEGAYYITVTRSNGHATVTLPPAPASANDSTRRFVSAQLTK